jgi:N-sulfoglucosamine sulfohydrolase
MTISKTLRQSIQILLGIMFVVFSACASESEDVKPVNILLCISDDQSFPHASAYGCTWLKTPAFDQVANEGLLFTNAYTPNSKCSPSRSALVTGRNPWQLEDAANHQPIFPSKFTSYAEVLSENGYHVGYTGKGWGPGKALDKEGNPRLLAGTAYNELTSKSPARGISTNDYAANFEKFLDDLPESTPFCFWYGAREPHRPYEFMAGSNMAAKELGDIDIVPSFWPDVDSVRHDMLDYAFEVEHFDMHIDRMLKLLAERGLLENTIVIVTSDNGMPFPRMKGFASVLSNQIPLTIMWKGGIEDPGRTVTDFVSFTDFAPTFLELAGIEPERSGMEPMEGRSLLPLFKGEKQDRSFMLFGKERTDTGRPDNAGYPIRGITQNDFVYIRNYHPERWPSGNPETGYRDVGASPTKSFILNQRRIQGQTKYWDINFGKLPAEELYSLKDDPFCMNNIADDSLFIGIKNELITLMTNELIKQEDPRVLGNGEIFETYLHHDESQRNFYEKFIQGDPINPNDARNQDVDKDWIGR